MRSWTLSMFPATVVAVGLTSTGVASATTSVPATPDELPANITAQAPVHTCSTLQNPGQVLKKAPCLDADLGVGVPNPAKIAGLARAAGGGLGAMRQGEGGLPRVVGAVIPALATVPEVLKTRPSVDLDVRPSYPGVLQSKSGNGLLGATIGPHQRNQNGVSALDTAAEIEAVHGYNLSPLADPLATVKSITAQPRLTTNTESPQQPAGVAPGKVLDGGLSTIVNAPGATLNAVRSIV